MSLWPVVMSWSRVDIIPISRSPKTRTRSKLCPIWSQVDQVDNQTVWLKKSCSLCPSQSTWSFSMVSAGYRHTVLDRSDGSAVACGENSSGQCDIPQLERGMRYTQASAGCGHTVLLRSDGTAVACGDNSAGHCNIPPLEEGIRYIQVSAGGAHSVLLRSDGKVAACGRNLEGQCDTTWLDEKIAYAQVSAGMFHTMLLQSDGLFVIPSNIDSIDRLGYLNFLSPLNEGIFHAQTSAGCYHTVLLHSDGNADGFSRDGNADAVHACNIPPLDEDMKYTQIDADYYHTVLLRSDGNAIACGGNSAGQCDIPPLDGEMSYIQVSAGAEHTVLLRSDGNVVACGRNDEGQCDIPSLKSWREFFSRQDARCRYICDSYPGYPLIGFLVVQADFVCEGDAVKLICSNLAGEETLRLDACRSDLLWDTYKRITHELKVNLQSLSGFVWWEVAGRSLPCPSCSSSCRCQWAGQASHELKSSYSETASLGVSNLRWQSTKSHRMNGQYLNLSL